MSVFSRALSGVSKYLGGPDLDSYLPDLPDLSGIFGGGEEKQNDASSGTSLWPSIITAGTGLLNSYYTQSQNSSLAEEYAKQQQAALAAQIALDEKKIAAQKEVAGMYAGAQVKAASIAAGAAKRNTLANLYNNWASNTEKGGEAEGQLAQNIGGMIGRSLDARQASLK